MQTLKKVKKQQLTLIRKAEQFIFDGEIPMMVAVILRLIELLPRIQKVHPEITGFYFGMGGGWFKGKITGWDNEEKAHWTTDASDLAEYLDEPERYVIVYRTNKAMYEALELIRYFVQYDNSSYNLLQPEGLNASTIIDEIRNDTVIFERDEVVTSPFGHEPKADTEKSKFYKALVKAGVKTQFVPQR